jgi:hypothetical protein
MGEERKSLRVFISAPAHNEPQKAGCEKLCQAVREAGCEVIFPDDLNPDNRIAALKASNLVIGWTDGLLPKGLHVHAITAAQPQIQLQFPPEIQGIIDAGWAATRGNNPSLRGSSKILLPGQAQEQADSPKGFTVGLGQNGVVCQLASPPINLPEGTVLAELGIAIGKNIPILIFAMAPGAAGDYFLPGVSPMVSSFEGLAEVLQVIIAAPTLEEGLEQILQSNLEDLEKMKEEAEKEEESESEQAEQPS